MDRTIIQPGQVILSPAKGGAACLIQAGTVKCYRQDDPLKTEVARYIAGDIIGEMNLAVNAVSDLVFEAISQCTVVTITRQDFEKKLSRADKTVQNVFRQMLKRMQDRALDDMMKDMNGRQQEKSNGAVCDENTWYVDGDEDIVVDEDAMKLVRGITSSLPEAKREKYEKIILPHLDGLLKDLKKARTN